MEMHYHLTKETRISLSTLLLAGFSLRQAAKQLGVSHSTISRELSRNRPKRSNHRYHPGDAQRSTNSRRKSANQRFRKIQPGSKLEQILVEKITVLFWSPEQIAGWMQRRKHPLRVCTQTIYHWIHTARKDLRPYLHCLKGKLRLTRGAKARREKRELLASHRHISNRPSYVEYRKTYGHWEGDTVHGKGKSGYIATFVERKSGYLIAVSIPDVSSMSFALAAKEAFEYIPARYKKTLTLDNGPEMKLPEKIERDTGLKVFYANPYHSWERGTNENTNGLLRFFFPKKSSFATLLQVQIDTAVHLLNTRPRKRLNWQTPVEVFKV